MSVAIKQYPQVPSEYPNNFTYKTSTNTLNITKVPKVPSSK